MPATSTTDSCTTIRSLRGRATRLADVARDEHPLLAQAYRRRASELELEAWVREQVVEPTPIPPFERSDDSELVAA
ncbi:MAG: hypothetical protein AAFZ07_05305 [Actinomycetota bacterium]